MIKELQGHDVTKTILVVEDNAMNMKLFQELLEAKGYTTLCATSGSAAILQLKSHTPDLILLDIQLPDVTGFDVLRLIKADPRLEAVPVIAITAFASKDDADKIMEAGFSAYMSKPITVPTFLDLVQKALSPAH